MYNFSKNAQTIITEAKAYGVSISLNNTSTQAHGSLEFASTFTGSESVRKHLERKMRTYNSHSLQGF